MLASLYIGNTHYVKLEGLHDPNVSPVEYLDDTAVVEASILDTAGVAVTNGTCTLAYVAASSGDFIGYLSYLAGITVNKHYTIRITVVEGTGKRARWDVPANSILRTGD